ncbi:MAG: hypothetical protein QM820_48150 [Minicystis sp.]
MRFVIAAGLALGVSAWAAACSTIETVAFSDGDCVAGGCEQGTPTSSSSTAASSSTGGMCTVNQNCSVKWATEIFAGMLDTPSAACTQTGVCHGSGKGGITLEAAKPHDAYLALTGYTLLDQPGPAKKYIVPCDQAGSGMLCNMKVDDADGGAATNPFGACGSTMPLLGTNLTMDQLTKIADWIACGAPEN